MPDQPSRLRRPFALGAALIVTAAAFLVASSGPVAAGRPLEFTITPASAEVGDIVTVASDVPCYSSDPEVEAAVSFVDADDVVVSTTVGLPDGEGNWTFNIDTTGLSEDTYTVKAACVTEQGPTNYLSKTLTLTAAPVETTTTTTTEAETTTSTTETPTTGAPGTDVPGTTTPNVDEEPNAAPATAVAGIPNYTG